MGSIDTTDRLLTDVVDTVARDSPDSLYCIQEVQANKTSWERITYERLAKGVDRVSWWIEEQLKMLDKPNGQVLAYIGANDIRYAVFILACMKTGNKVLLSSTRNSQAASRHLLEETGCSVIVDGSEKPLARQNIDDLVTGCADLSLCRWTMDSMHNILLSTDPVEPYLQKGTFAELENTTVAIIHSSGTTGHPKPVVINHGYIATFDRMRNLPVPPGRKTSHLFLRSQGVLRLLYGPFFHWVGVSCLVECIFYQTPFLVSPDRPMTPSLFSEIMNLENPPQWAVAIPPLMEGLCTSEEGQRALAKMSDLNYGSAPVRRDVGNKIASFLNLQAILASSETSYTPTLLCEDPADWDYLEWNPNFDHRMEEVDDGLWELVLLKPSSFSYHAIFYSHPQLSEYHTGDLFRPHPSKKGLWHYECRGDDIIVLSNGEKFNPIRAEKHIQSHPMVNYAAVFGQNRFQPAVLIEPNWEALDEEWEGLEKDWSPEVLRRDILPVIREVNTFLPSYAKIFGTHIAFASRDRPFALSPKMTLRRRIIGKEYEDTLDRLYGSDKPEIFEGTSEQYSPRSAFHPWALPGSTLSEIQSFIQGQIGGLLRYRNLTLDDNLFEIGMNSLQAVRLTQLLQTALESHTSTQPIKWTSALIYDRPTIRELSETVHQEIHRIEVPKSRQTEGPWSRRDMISKAIWQQARSMDGSGLTVALTGSTGELGTYLLDSLLNNKLVRQVYCLNRTEDAAERQLLSFQKKKLLTMWLIETSRAQFWHVDLEKEFLGLELDEYKVLQNVDIFIHNAWPVNFNQPLSTFEPQLVGVRHLLNLVGKAERSPRFHFISSVSTVGASNLGSKASVPEKVLDSSYVQPYGYAESKFVAEALCEIASQREGSRIAIHRVGQLGGPSTPLAGVWNPKEWFPSLIRTSKTMGMLPDSLGPVWVDWLPIDVAAQIITEIVIPPREHRYEAMSVFHTCNPKATDWSKLVPSVAKACNASVVPLENGSRR